MPRMLYDSLCDKVGDKAGFARAMDITVFEDLIDRLGDDLSRWPDDQRRSAEAFLAASAEARALHAEAVAVRQALAAPPVRAPRGLADRIVAAAGKLPREQAPRDEEGSTDNSTAPAPSGKVLPALLLALFLLPALATPALLPGEPDSLVSTPL